MALKTTTEQLEETQAAISRVLESQEYQEGRSRNARAQLRDLQEREDRLLARLRREQNAANPAILTAAIGRDY